MTAPSTTFYIKQNDTDPAIIEYMRNADGSPINLSSATVMFHLRSSSGTIKVNRSATILDVANSKVEYQWIVGDTDTAGTYYREWEIQLSSGRVVTIPNDILGYPVVITDDIA